MHRRCYQTATIESILPQRKMGLRVSGSAIAAANAMMGLRHDAGGDVSFI